MNAMNPANTLRIKTAEQLGLLLMANIEQGAHIQNLGTQLDALQESLKSRDEAPFQALEQCILSGQVPEADVPALVASVPGFAEWRAAKAAPQEPAA